MIKKIPTEEMNYFNTICIDEVGDVFEWNNRIFRGIPKKSKALVDKYFSSGFMDHIVQEGMFPKTYISEYSNPKYCYILEHEKIDLQTIDAEWSFDMLKDAAILVCKLADIAWQFGFNMKDCHTKNILFHNNKPIYVDLGSFVEIEEGTTGFKSYEQILGYYYYVLKLWSDGCMSFPKQLQALYKFEKRDYLLYKYPLYRHWGRFLNAICNVEEKLFILSTVSSTAPAIQNSQIARFLWRMVNKYRLFYWQRTNTFVRRITKIRRPQSLKNTIIESYSITFSKEIRDIFDGLNDIVIVNPSCYNFLAVLLTEYESKNIITIDVDEKKGNSIYLKYRDSNYSLTNLSFNLCYPKLHYNYQTPPCKRLKAHTFVVVNPQEIVKGMRKPVVVLYKTLLDYEFNMLVVIEEKSANNNEEVDSAIARWYEKQMCIQNGDLIIKTYRKNEVH